jgi:hypothetical protein
MKRFLLLIAFILPLVSCHRSINHDDLLPTIINDQLKKHIIAFHYSARPEYKTNIISLWVYVKGDTTAYAFGHERNLYGLKETPPIFITRLNDLIIIIRTEKSELSGFSISETAWEHFCKNADPEGYRQYKLFGRTDCYIDDGEPLKVIFFYKGKFLR